MPIGGTAAQTLGPATVAGAATAPVDGDLASTLAPATTVATGSVAIDGAGAATLADASVAAAAKALVDGDAALGLDDATAAATAIQNTRAELAITLDDATGVGAGDVPVAAVLANPLSGDTLDAAGTVAIVGGANVGLRDTVTSTDGSVFAPLLLNNRAARIIEKHGESMTLKRKTEATAIVLKGKRIQGEIEETGNSAVQQQFRVKIGPNELGRSEWGRKHPQRTDQMVIGGKTRIILDVRPLKDRGAVKLFELTVAG